MKLPDNATASGAPRTLYRRGVKHGQVLIVPTKRTLPLADAVQAQWQAAQPVHLPALLLPEVEKYANEIRDALHIMRRVRAGESCIDILVEEPFISRLEPDFDLLSPVHSGDAQEIEKIVFDAVKSGELFAEDLWMKVSCLSFFDDDNSIRFRFSYGMEMFKNQEDDPLREALAAELAARVFPECRMLSDNVQLRELLAAVLDFSPLFVERIIYSNAPGGGAQFHQDVENDHVGIVYAQLYGHTAWLALPRVDLLRHVCEYLAADDSDAFAELRQRAQNQASLVELIESDDQGALEILLNATPAFTARLIEAGCGLTLAPGDVLLLPQASSEHCCWHSVFCLDDSALNNPPGHSLSFAITQTA
ncbi:MAG: hypothetical protein Q9M25_00445 [Mariprofundaceae bacterium]|nr:hypothetical protein [Mariprofundaceae bacterium]